MSNTTTTFRVRVGADGRTHFETSDFEAAHEYALGLSDRGALHQAEVLSSRSGKIGIYRDGEQIAFLSGNGAWVEL